ncbi:PD-(D/E)XK nuclease family protein [Frisingicoccus sp.]|uniref:PD-(D/E)XK nuclease family protein n=3 Tax=Frisingicoccus sp. TaxID=1918627 RepID=UPI003A2F419D
MISNSTERGHEMSLQMVIGGAGTRRSEIMYRKLIEESLAAPEQNFYLVVPEQYTMQTQMKMTELHPGHGVMNVDVVSFPRLAYRVFDELGGIRKTILEDTGKSMVIRRLLSEHKNELEAFASSVGKSGFVGQAKSMLSELFQYSVRSSELSESRKQVGEHTMLGKKLGDIQILYDAFKEYMSDTYMTSEELLEVLAQKVPDSGILKDSIMYIDNFTGFTPSQYSLLEKLMLLCKRLVIGLSIDVHDKPYELGQEYQLFYLTKETLWKLNKMCIRLNVEKEPDILLDTPGAVSRNELNFMEKHLFRFHRFRPWQGIPEHLKVYALGYPAEEVGFAAGEIQRMVMDEGMSYKDFAMVTGDVSRYREACRRQFDSVGIPLFIDDKANLSENSFVEMLRSGMDVILKDFSYESVFRYLRSGYSLVAASEVDVLDNYLLATGIRGRKRWSEKFIKRYRDFGPEDFVRINETRKQVVKELEPLFEMGRQGTVGDYTKALRTFIQEIHGEEQLGAYSESFKAEGDFVREREYAQVYEAVDELLEKCEQILENEKVSLKEYMEILEAGFAEIQLGVIPPTLDQVVLGDLKRTRLGDVKVIFILGCNDGVIPTPVSVGGLITDREKEVLAACPVELAPTGKQNNFREKFYIYTAMTKPEQKLVMTYAQMDGSGKAIRPSTLLNDVYRIFPDLRPEIPELWDENRILTGMQESGYYLLEGLKKPEFRNDFWQTLFAWFSEHDGTKEKLSGWLSQLYDTQRMSPLSQRIIKALYGERPRASITTLEKYAACAYAHFLSAGLRLEERKTSKLLPPDLGNILHQSMERFSKAVEESDYDWHTMPDTFRDETMERCVRETGMEYGSAMFLENARYRHYLEQLVRMAKRTAWTIQKQICKGEFVPAGFETKFSVGERVRLIGTVDRYDVYDGEEARAVRIVDYKSGQKEFDLTEIFYGLSLQLVVYMESIARIEEERHPEKPIVKAGMFYYHIQDPILEEMPGNPEELDDQLASMLKLEGLVNDDPQVVAWMDEKLSEAPQVLPVSLKKDGTFSKTSSIASKDQLDELGYLVHRRIEQLAEGWMSGDISKNPYVLINGSKKRTACDFCSYRGICRFDEQVEGCEYHRLMHLSADEVWQRIYEEVREAWENRGPKNSGRS